MFIDFSKLFHQASKDRARGHAPIPADMSLWPKSWVNVEYKTYPGLARITLPEVTRQHDLFQAIRERRSGRDPHKGKVMLEEIATLLRYSCGEVRAQENKRAQPSGGERYPIEAYVLVFLGSPGLTPGIYHYAVGEHVLEVLSNREFSAEDIREIFPIAWVGNAACTILLTAVFDRTKRKYGERGYRYILLEAGHIGQNLSLVAAALGISCCVSSTNDEVIDRLLSIDGVSESLVYNVVLGR